MLRTIWATMSVTDGLLEQVEEHLLHGDGAKRTRTATLDPGRVDDVLNVAGHRIGTMEVESALVDHPRWRRRPWWDARTS